MFYFTALLDGENFVDSCHHTCQKSDFSKCQLIKIFVLYMYNIMCVFFVGVFILATALLEYISLCAVVA